MREWLNKVRQCPVATIKRTVLLRLATALRVCWIERNPLRRVHGYHKAPGQVVKRTFLYNFFTVLTSRHSLFLSFITFENIPHRRAGCIPFLSLYRCFLFRFENNYEPSYLIFSVFLRWPIISHASYFSVTFSSWRSVVRYANLLRDNKNTNTNVNALSL